MRLSMKKWRQLWGEEKGSVMTEFVITLPIFVMMFVGIVELNKTERAMNEVHIMANKMMWETSIEVMKSSPASEWGDPHKVANVAPEPESGCPAERYHECAGYDWNKYKRLNDYGTIGEMLSGADFETVAEYLDRNENKSLFDLEEEVDLRMYESVYETRDVWGEYAINATWDRGYEAHTIPPGEPPGAFTVFANARLEDGTGLYGGGPSMMAYGAGTRYGLILANVQKELQTKLGNVDLEYEYQTVAPSRPMETDREEYFTVGTSRLTMKDSGFEEIPGFEYEFRLDGFYIDTLVE